MFPSNWKETLMVRRTTRRETLSVLDKSQYLALMGSVRDHCTSCLAKLTLDGEDYMALHELVEFIDMHQEQFTGDASYYRFPANNWITVLEPDNDR
jgi:hypothetical protein